MDLNDRSDLKSLVENELQSLGYRKSDIKMSRGTSIGDNYLAVITLIDINTSNKEGKPLKLHWIAKSAHQNKQFREHVRIDLVFSREIYIYTEVLPAFEQLQLKNALSQPFKCYPHFITSSMEHMHETVVMENLKANGFIMRNRTEPLDYFHTKYVLTNYAKFHALSFALRDQDPGKFEEIADGLKSNFFDGSNREAMQTTMSANCARAAKGFGEKDEEELKLLRYLEEHAYDVLLYSCNGDEAGEHGVVLHGDSWINNMLFKYDNPEEPRKPTHMVLLDYQLSRLGSPAADLTYFLYTCTDGKLREQHYEQLLEDYYDAFSEFLFELGSDPQKLFPYEALLDHLKRFSAYGVLMSMMVLHLMLSDSDEIPDLTGDDLDLNTFTYESRNVSAYLARVKDVIRDVLRYKYDLYTKA